jgi:hypothetical protein
MTANAAKQAATSVATGANAFIHSRKQTHRVSLGKQHPLREALAGMPITTATATTIIIATKKYGLITAPETCRQSDYHESF